MKKAYEYLDEIESVQFVQSGNIFHRNSVVEKLIKQIQIDTIEETVKLCAETIEKLDYEDFYVFGSSEDENRINSYELHGLKVSSDSILNCAEILKKELE